MGKNLRRKKTEVIKRFLPTKSLLMNLGLLTAGSFILAFGVNAILVPQQFLSGGALGSPIQGKVIFIIEFMGI